MAIGNWGKIIKFEVTSKKMLTFSDFKRTVSGRWNEHPIIGEKTKTEFAGTDAGNVSMEITLSAEQGVNPRAILDKLEKAVESGNVDYLYIGGKKVGTGKMVLESVSETWDEIWKQGELVRARATLVFKEYR